MIRVGPDTAEERLLENVWLWHTYLTFALVMSMSCAMFLVADISYH